jgi:CBS domain-containing protein
MRDADEPIMKAGELCIRNVATATGDESVVAAARRMVECGAEELIVVDERAGLRRPIGLVTDHDLVVRVLTRGDCTPSALPIGEVMRRKLVTATEDDDIERVVATMREHAMRRIPIVDRRGGLHGILAIDDVLGWMRAQIEAAHQLLEDPAAPPTHVR